MWSEKNAKYLSKENIKNLAPSVFSETPSKEVSKHYVHIPTERVIDDMEVLGWKVVDARKSQQERNQQLDFKNIYWFLEMMKL